MKFRWSLLAPVYVAKAEDDWSSLLQVAQDPKKHHGMEAHPAVFASHHVADLAFYPPSIHHKYQCADDGIWKGSCDIDLKMPTENTMVVPTIFTPADWSKSCDPWKGVTELKDTIFKGDDGVWVDKKNGTVVADWKAKNGWTCPKDQRSMSGCGDFRTDTRGLKCEKKIDTIMDCKRPGNMDRRTFAENDVSSMLIPQRHVCIQHPLFFDNLNTGSPVVPPALGRHRERWAKWGEYDYLPPQRWMHNNEHGSVIFLYNQCLGEAMLCNLRRYIQKWQDRLGSIKWDEKRTDGFRFILTPFKDLNVPISIVMWGHVYSSKCFNEHDMDYFIEKWYRNGFEDWPPSGAYDHLWRNITETAAKCPALPDPGPIQTSQMLTAREADVEALQKKAGIKSGIHNKLERAVKKKHR